MPPTVSSASSAFKWTVLIMACGLAAAADAQDTNLPAAAPATPNAPANLGVVWQDDRLGGKAARTATSPDPLILPSFYRVAAGLSYRLRRPADLSLHVANLLDEKIFVDGTTGANLQWAAPRTVTLRFGCHF